MPTPVANTSAAQTADLLRLMATAMQRDARAADHVRFCVAPDAAALLDLTQRLLQATSPRLLLRFLAEGLKELTDCRTVVVARRRGNRCCVEAVSQVDSFDPHAESILQYEDQCTAALTDDGFSADGYSTIRFYDSDERPTFVCLLLDENAAACEARRAWLPQIAETIGPALYVKWAVLEQSRWQRSLSRAAAACRLDRRTVWAVAAVLLLLSFIPRPYRVSCECVVEPVVRRHAAAPFDGVFAESLCKPGDFVASGQVLGRLDAKELRWELAAVVADRERAAKSRDMNQSAGKTAAAQIDRLEAQRLDERRKLLESRFANLEIKSPIAGVVVTGDLDRAQGAPVKLGQSLYEIAPLDRMVIEAAVPEREIDRIRVDQTVRVKLNSQWSRSIEGRVERIYPRAEIRDDANVFIAQSTIDNADGKLRPGMKGTAAVETEYRPLIWILGHRIVETLYRWLT